MRALTRCVFCLPNRSAAVLKEPQPQITAWGLSLAHRLALWWLPHTCYCVFVALENRTGGIDLSIGLTKWWGATRQQDKRKSQTGWKEALNRNMFDKPLDWRYTLRRLKVHISVVVSLSHEARLNPILKYEGTCNEKSKAVSPSHNLSFHLPCFLSLWGELCSSRPWLCRRGQKKEWQQRKKKVGKEEGCRDEGPWCRQCWFEE